MVVNCVSHNYEILSTPLIKLCLFNAVNRTGRQPNARKKLSQEFSCNQLHEENIGLTISSLQASTLQLVLAIAPKVIVNQTVKQ